MKVVINNAVGGYGLSAQCIELMIERGYTNPDSDLEYYLENKGTYDYDNWCVCSHDRSNELLISILEEKGSEWCSGAFSTLCIVEIPDGVEWYVGEYEDGTEYVAEKHRVWVGK